MSYEQLSDEVKAKRRKYAPEMRLDMEKYINFLTLLINGQFMNAKGQILQHWKDPVEIYVLEYALSDIQNTFFTRNKVWSALLRRDFPNSIDFAEQAISQYLKINTYSPRKLYWSIMVAEKTEYWDGADKEFWEAEKEFDWEFWSIWSSSLNKYEFVSEDKRINLYKFEIYRK